MQIASSCEDIWRWVLHAAAQHFRTVSRIAIRCSGRHALPVVDFVSPCGRSASRPGSGQPGSAGWGSRGALKAFPSRPGSAEDREDTAQHEETTPQQTRISGQIGGQLSAGDAGSSLSASAVGDAVPEQAEAAPVMGRARPAAAAADGPPQPSASQEVTDDALGAHMERAEADAVATPTAPEGTGVPRETSPIAAAPDATLSRKRPRAIDLESASSPAAQFAAAPASLDAYMQGSSPDGDAMSLHQPRGRSASNESFFSTAEEAEENMEVEASASSYASSAAYSPASSVADGADTPGVAQPPQPRTAFGAVPASGAAALGQEADSCMPSQQPDAASMEVAAAPKACCTGAKTTAEEQVSAAHGEQSSSPLAAQGGLLEGCSPAHPSSLDAPLGSATAMQGESAAVQADEGPAASVHIAAGGNGPRAAEPAGVAALAAAAALRSPDSKAPDDQASVEVETSGASPGFGKRRRVDQEVGETICTVESPIAITTAPEAVDALAALEPAPLAATHAHARGVGSASAAANQAEADHYSGANAAERAGNSGDVMAGVAERERSQSPVISAALAAGVTVRHKRGGRRKSSAAKAAKIGAAAEATTSGAAAGSAVSSVVEAAKSGPAAADAASSGTVTGKAARSGTAPGQAARSGVAAGKHATLGTVGASATSSVAGPTAVGFSAASKACYSSAPADAAAAKTAAPAVLAAVSEDAEVVLPQKEICTASGALPGMEAAVAQPALGQAPSILRPEMLEASTDAQFSWSKNVGADNSPGAAPTEAPERAKTVPSEGTPQVKAPAASMATAASHVETASENTTACADLTPDGVSASKPAPEAVGQVMVESSDSTIEEVNPPGHDTPEGSRAAAAQVPGVPVIAAAQADVPVTAAECEPAGDVSEQQVLVSLFHNSVHIIIQI